MRLRIIKVGILSLVLGFWAHNSEAQGIFNSLNGLPSMGQAIPVTDPSGYFSVVISPSFFTCTVLPGNVQCTGVLPVSAHLSIQLSEVPASATAALVSLNTLEQYENLANFKLIQSSKTVIDQIPAIVQTFVYTELNNVERPIWMQVLSAVQGTKLVAVQIQCRSGTCAEYGAGMNQVFSTLHIAPLDKAGMPVKGNLKRQNKGPTLDSVIKGLEF
jgi:hypothetical protein